MYDDTAAVKEKTAETDLPSSRSSGPRKVKRKKKAVLLWTLWVILVLVILAGLGVGILSVRYQDHFFPKTYIDKIEVSNMTVPEATAVLESAGDAVNIRLSDGEEDLATLPLSSLIGENVIFAMVGDAFSQQHADGFFFSWMEGATWLHTGDLLGYPDKAALSALLEDTMYGETGRIQPEDAYIDLGEGGYTLVPEVRGNIVNIDLCAEVLAAAVAGESDLTARDILVEVSGARVLPEVLSDDEELLARGRQLDNYLSASVTLDFQDGNTYTLTPEDIYSITDIRLDDEDAECVPDPERVRELTDKLADDLGLDGVYAKFRNVVPTRELIYYRVGDKGWRLDRDRLAADVADALASGTDSTVVPHYDYTWYWQDYYNIGNTFVEVSIDNQYLWYYVDGELLVETPVVTGNLATGDLTRRGCFKIYGMVTDTTLTGPTWNDHVDYWMPFDGGIGFHDSSWRDEYGGDIYITDGSHGCVNTPLDAVATIYENISKGVPVVVY
ncbi:MAG: L,D-transpeptidase [Oscillospiraceae bacterium]|nr:L,D-transpeptidase [Oscillospiraceae bacterium]